MNEKTLQEAKLRFDQKIKEATRAYQQKIQKILEKIRQRKIESLRKSIT